MKKFSFLDIKNKLKESKGYVLLNMILLFLVLLMLIVAVSMSAISNQKQSVHSKDHNSIYYYAEGGIHEFVDATKGFINQLSQEDKKSFMKMDMVDLKDYLEVHILDSNTGLGLGDTDSKIMSKAAQRNIQLKVGSEIDKEIIVLSTAQLGGVQRSVEQSVFNLNGGGDKGEAVGMCVANAMTANSKFIFNGAANIYGKVKLLKPEKGSIEWNYPLNIKDLESDENIEFRNGIYHPSTDLSMDDIVSTTAFVQREALLKKVNGVGPHMNTYHPNSSKEVMPDTEMEPSPIVSKDHEIESWRVPQVALGVIYGPEFGKIGSFSIFDNMTIDFASGDQDTFYASELRFTKINSFNTITIDVGNKDVHLILDKINLLHNIIQVKGEGTLKISVLKTDDIQLNPYGFYHEDAIKLLDGLNDDLFFDFDKQPQQHEAHQKNIAQAKHKITIQLYNPSNHIKSLVLKNETHAIQTKQNKAFASYNLIAKNYNIKFDSISQRPKFHSNGSFDKYIRTSQFNVILYGDQVTLDFPSTIAAGEGFTLADIYFVPSGKIKFEASGFSGAMIADVIEIGNTQASLYFNVDADGILPPDFSIFDTSCNDDSPGLPGDGNNQGGITLGPIREVK